jgi:hypothetical protein
MAEKDSSLVEKYFKFSNILSFGLLGIAILTASSTLAMASAIDMTSNAIMAKEYRSWKERKNKAKK